MSAKVKVLTSKITYEIEEIEVAGCYECRYLRNYQSGDDPKSLARTYYCGYDGHKILESNDSLWNYQLKNVLGEVHKDCSFLKKNERGSSV